MPKVNAKNSSSPSYDYTDVFGRQRESLTNKLLLTPIDRKTPPFFATDALLAAEVVVGCPPNDFPPPMEGQDEGGRAYPRIPIITSPNADWLPDLSQDHQEILIRTDGRYYTNDFTLWPQWYFPETAHLPYIRVRPAEDEMNTHPIKLVWHDLKRADFLFEESSAFTDLGRVHPDLAEVVLDHQRELSNEIRQFAKRGETNWGLIGIRDLLYFERTMQTHAITLRCAPQSWFLTRATFTTFQRAYLEALACLDYLKTYIRHNGNTPNEPERIRSDLLGAVTHDVSVAVDLYMQGIPVWLVRRPQYIAKDMIIVNTDIRPSVPIYIESRPEPGVKPVYKSGEATAYRNRACQLLRAGNIRLSTAANATASEGDRVQVATARLMGLPPPNAIPYASTGRAPRPADRFPVVAFLPARKKFQFNIDKFSEPQAKNYPSAISTWKDALSAVDRSPKYIRDHSFFEEYRGYGVFDPAVFANPKASSDSRVMYMTCWLYVRAAWLARFTEGKVEFIFPKSQDWKDWIRAVVAPALGYPVPQDGHEKDSRRKTPRELERLFGLRISGSASLVDLAWQGTTIATFMNVRRAHIQFSSLQERQIVWDLVEQNFRLELLCLDSSIHPRVKMNRYDEEERNSMVAACFPEKSVISLNLPNAQKGLGAPGWMDRVEYANAFQEVLETWPRGDAYQVGSMGPFDSEEELVKFEKVAYKFYCQTFFEFFARAPTIPRILPFV